MERPRIYVGTSGWTYDDWWGAFYPDEVNGPERLSYYATVFDAVEVNATFYRNPAPSAIKAWNTRLGPAFHLVVKGSRAVTHLKKLHDFDEALARCLDRVLQLKRLRVILWQLPPSLHVDVERLDAFLRVLPISVRHAVEFRHESWWADEVAGVLARYKAAFVAVSHPKLPSEWFTTTDLLYVRFHGLGSQLYSYDYSRDELVEWVERLKPDLKGRTLYAFFNNDYNANAPRNALVLRELLERAVRSGAACRALSEASRCPSTTMQRQCVPAGVVPCGDSPLSTAGLDACCRRERVVCSAPIRSCGPRTGPSCCRRSAPAAAGRSTRARRP
jgi:uncharacterized protein YecE (DUF72 family)